MNGSDDPMTLRIGTGDDLSGRFWDFGGSAAADDRPVLDPSAGFINLAFIRETLKRRAWLWCATALVGLVIGTGLYMKYPPAYQASASVLIQDGPGADPVVAIQTDAALADSRTVAARVVQQLGLQQSVTSFHAAYTVAVVTDQVLLITVGAPSSADAVSRASAVAQAFLQFHADYAQTQQQQLVTGLDQQLSQAQQRLNSINNQITAKSAQPGSPVQQAELASLAKQRDAASNTLGQVQQYVTSAVSTGQTSTNEIVNGSRVVDTAAPIPHSHVKAIALYVAGGLFGGLAVGMGIVIVMALVSVQLRRRDDVADALGAPVRLSVGRLSVRRWRPRLPGRASAHDLNMRRVVAYLHAMVPGSSRGPAGLAVVAVENARVVARAVAALAVFSASQGKQVVVADLSDGARAARRLGVKDPGVHAVSQNGVNLTVVVPDQADVAPVGPLGGHRSPGRPAQPSETLVAACLSADLLLTLTSLDPAFGGEHLGTWATDAVVVVTTGQSTGERIHGVGEMIRLAGTRLDSAVLIEADKSDESLGVAHTDDEPVPVGPL